MRPLTIYAFLGFGGALGAVALAQQAVQPPGMQSTYSLGAQTDLGPPMGITLFEDEKTGETVTLKPTESLDASWSTTTYQGKLSPRAGRSLAFEFQFGVNPQRKPSAQVAGQAGD